MLFCTRKEDNQYSTLDSNMKLLTITIIKNQNCNTNKNISLLFFKIDKNSIDKCFFDIYFLECEKWLQNQISESCNNLGISIK